MCSVGCGLGALGASCEEGAGVLLFVIEHVIMWVLLGDWVEVSGLCTADTLSCHYMRNNNN